MSQSEQDSGNRPDGGIRELEIVTLGQRFCPYTEPMQEKVIKRNNLPDGIARYKQVAVPEVGGVAEISWIPGMYLINMPTRTFDSHLPYPDPPHANRYTGRKYEEYLRRDLVNGYISISVTLTVPVSQPLDRTMFAFLIEYEEMQLVSRFPISIDRDEQKGIVFSGGNKYWQAVEDSPIALQDRIKRWTGNWVPYMREDGEQLIVPDNPLELGRLQMQIFRA